MGVRTSHIRLSNSSWWEAGGLASLWSIDSSRVLVAPLTAGSCAWTSISGDLKYLCRKSVRVHSEALRCGQSVALPQRRSLRSPAHDMFMRGPNMHPYEALEDIDGHFERVLSTVIMVHERGMYRLPLLNPSDVTGLWHACREGWIQRCAEGFMDLDG